jgi:signal transduction histidine kinase
LPELENQGYVEWLNDALRRSQTQSREVPLRRAGMSARPKYWTLLCRRVEEERGSRERGMIALVDATTEVLAQTALEQQAAQANVASRAKEEFFAALSHELRGPISPIVRALELLRLRGFDTREQAIIERQVKHLTRLVDDLLDTARIERGIVVLRRERLALDTIVAHALEMVEPLLKDRGQQVSTDVPKDLLVDVDPDRMRQVIANLLTNAAKCSGPRSEISVSAARQQGRVLLSIIDHGIGMTPVKLACLFNPDFRPETSHGGGLGLGLVIVRKLVRQHGGDVRAYSDGLGKGSQFVVELPCADVAEVGAAEPQVGYDHVYGEGDNAACWS